MLTIKTLAYREASGKLHGQALQELPITFDFEPDSDKSPDILYFITGGSEAEALHYLDKNKFQLLITTGKSNAYASATEVKAYANANGYQTVLLCLDDPGDKERLKKYARSIDALDDLAGKRIGLLGEVSEWLVSSTIDAKLLKRKLGIELIEFAWSDAGDFRDFQPSQDFQGCFPADGKYHIKDAARVDNLLRKLVEDHALDAITVECFSLVKEHGVTACLGLSHFNDMGIPAGCEGDLCSIVGMMMVREITGHIPWMANVAGINGNVVLFAHCTAPTSLLSEYRVATHFETGKGTAVQGTFDAQEVTVFRINNTLDKAFLCRGQVVDGEYEENACRTQLHVRLDGDAIQELKTNPLGNHHLLLPGDQVKDLEALCRVLSLEIRA